MWEPKRLTLRLEIPGVRWGCTRRPATGFSDLVKERELDAEEAERVSCLGLADWRIYPVACSADPTIRRSADPNAISFSLSRPANQASGITTRTLAIDHQAGTRPQSP